MMQSIGQLDRSKYLGGSDVAGILGISPWRTPLDVYLDKVQPRKEPPSPGKQKIFSRGQRMEPYVIDLLSEETGLVIARRGERYLDPELPFIAAEIDAEAESGENIEIKTCSPFKAREWGEQQTDAIPVHYTAQAMHGLMVTGKKVCVFGVLIGADDFRVYRVERDDETIAAIREKEIQFWEMVTTLSPPPVTAVSDVMRIFDRDSGTGIEADGKALDAVLQLRELQARRKEITDEIEFAEQKLKLFMQQNSFISLEGKQLATWRTQNSTRFNIAAFKEAHPELYDAFKTTTKSRVFRIK
ncbi:YqaJ viral recombinase family nuclease [Pantoea piersonii]|uniref:YqaJ viral recombinase family nuclease n=1 Tax=Pantoea piersonii TaxID=2364647 RepID=UPI002897551D|nr:YqaJ viral recombinase family protein [Pantoea piersonii]